MIVVGVRGLSGPLDTSFPIPVIGVRVTLRSLIGLMCQASDADPTLCQLITSRPSDACKYMLQKGTAWISSKVSALVTKFINRVASTFSCPGGTWKDTLKDVLTHAITVSFSDTSGFTVDIDWANVATDVLCFGAQSAMSKYISPFVNGVIAKLQSACGSATPSGSSVSATSSPSALWSASSTSTAPAASSSTVTQTSTPKSLTQVTSQKPLTMTEAGAVYRAQQKPNSSAPLVWGAVGVALLGTGWLVFRR
jgi:hypothetical protein